MYTPEQSYELILLMLCIWREARGESMDAKHAVGWVIRNRAMRPGKQWYGNSYAECILKPYQFSSFNANDPNAVKFPLPDDPSYAPCLLAAKHVYDGTLADNTGGSDYYFDDSMAANPPKWAATLTPTVKIGRLNFFKEAG